MAGVEAEVTDEARGRRRAEYGHQRERARPLAERMRRVPTAAVRR